MKLNDLNLDYVKKYLSVDHELDDLRIQAHINTAINYIKLSHGYEQMQELEDNECLADIAMMIIQDLYDNGTITATKSISFMSIDRRF